MKMVATRIAYADSETKTGSWEDDLLAYISSHCGETGIPLDAIPQETFTILDTIGSSPASACHKPSCVAVQRQSKYKPYVRANVAVFARACLSFAVQYQLPFSDTAAMGTADAVAVLAISGISDLAKKVGMSYDRVQQVMTILLILGFVRKLRKGRSFLYVVPLGPYVPFPSPQAVHSDLQQLLQKLRREKVSLSESSRNRRSSFRKMVEGVLVRFEAAYGLGANRCMGSDDTDVLEGPDAASDFVVDGYLVDEQECDPEREKALREIQAKLPVHLQATLMHEIAPIVRRRLVGKACKESRVWMGSVGALGTVRTTTDCQSAEIDSIDLVDEASACQVQVEPSVRDSGDDQEEQILPPGQQRSTLVAEQAHLSQSQEEGGTVAERQEPGQVEGAAVSVSSRQKRVCEKQKRKQKRLSKGASAGEHLEGSGEQTPQEEKIVPHLEWEEIRSRAVELSLRYDRSDGGMGLYIERLREDPLALRLAVVDALVRGRFPDPGFHPQELRGGWVNKRYKAYHRGEVAPPHILAWAQTEYSYKALEDVLDDVAEWQDSFLPVGETRRRPFPTEVIVKHSDVPAYGGWGALREQGYLRVELENGALLPSDIVIEEEALRDFWLYGGGRGLEEQGYLYVDMEDGDLLSLSEYHELRLRGLCELNTYEPLFARPADPDEQGSTGGVVPLSPEVEYEVDTYLEWVQSLAPSREAVAAQIAKMQPWVARLAEILDPEEYAIEMVATPLWERVMLEIRDKQDPQQSKLLTSGQQAQKFIQTWKMVLQSRGAVGEPEYVSFDERQSVFLPENQRSPLEGGPEDGVVEE